MHMSSWLKTVLFLALSAFLTRLIPYSSVFRSLDTMVHEFGHAVVTLLLSGQVMYIELFADHSGVTYSKASSGWSLIPISLAGYMLASLFAVFLFRSQAKGKQRFGLQMITLIAIVSLVLFVRNTYGIVWISCFTILNIFMLALAPRWLMNVYYLLIAFLTLEESVFGPISLAVYAYLDPTKAGDASNLSRFTPFPSLAWAVLFVLFSLWCAKQAIAVFSGRRGRRHSSAGARYSEQNPHT
jgi:hypothetical protein